MPLYIPWLTEGIKKRGVRYLLHHYLGQFFEEKLTLEQLSIDIYEGKGSIRNLALDVDGLNDELDFIPFRFLEGCLIGQISVEVPWSSLATDACKVELDGAKFYCRLKTSADATKSHCRSLMSMTSSMQMAEEIVTTEDADESENPMLHHNINTNNTSSNKSRETRKKNANQMFEGLEMFAQLIDSVLRRTKLTARNTLFQIKPYHEKADQDEKETTDGNENTHNRPNLASSSRSSGDEFSEPLARSGSDDEESVDSDDNEEDEPEDDRTDSRSKSTVEFFIKFFRCEEMIDQSRTETGLSTDGYDHDNDGANKSLSAIPETITKLLTLEDVEMRIDGIPVSNLVGKHTITIKFNGQKSEISVFSGSPLLAVISHKQLETFFNVFDGVHDQSSDVSFLAEKDQKLLSPEDYAKIENQLLETATMRNIHASDTRSTSGYSGIGSAKSVASNSKNSYYNSTQVLSGTGGGARRWVGSCDPYPNSTGSTQTKDSEHGYHSHFSTKLDSQQGVADMKQSCETSTATEPTLNHIEAFSCELKLPGIWLCIVRSGQPIPALIKPFADSINSFQSINKYIDGHIKVPHIRLLALKVALDITALGTNVFLGDLDISEYLEDATRMNPVLKILNNDQANVPMSSSRYKASITNGREINVELLTKTRVMFDPTIIDRVFQDYKLLSLDQNDARSSQQRAQVNLTIRADKFKLELMCPIPDLTPDASIKRTQLRPQSFIFDFADINMTWRADRLKLVSNELTAFVKTQPKQLDSEAVKFIESTFKGNDKIELLLEPSPSNLDNDFTKDIEQALNESSMYESIYISQASESKIPTEPFQTKRKVVRASFQSQQTSCKPNSARISECDHEKILTPGDRQHLLEYLEQTVASTRLSLNLHLPVCEVEFEDKEQLDLIYNRFGNDFVFWQPQTLAKNQNSAGRKRKSTCRSDRSDGASGETLEFKPVNQYGDQVDDDNDQQSSDADNEGSEGSYHSISREVEDKISSSNPYDNEVTCKIVVDELLVRFNHQSCAAALKQAISADNLLLGVVIDVNKKPNTLLSLVTDNLKLSNELETVLEGNLFCNKKSTFSLTAEIKRPTRALKDIKLAIQLRDGLFNDIRAETYSRFWQSINVTDEPILGYVAPQIITELHVDILNTGLLLVREGARPALLSIDELYMTSMVMEQTSQVMIRLIADEVSLYMKRDRQGLEVMKNYICLIDSGLIDVDFKFGGDKRIEFGVINNVITLRVCQDSLSALFRLINVIVKSASVNQNSGANNQGQRPGDKTGGSDTSGQRPSLNDASSAQQMEREKTATKRCEWAATNQFGSAATAPPNSPTSAGKDSRRNREMKLLVDAMNDYTISTKPSSRNTDGLRGSDLDEDCVERNDRGDNKDKVGHDADDGGGDRARESSDKDDDESKASDDGPQEQDYDSDAPPVFQRTNSAGTSTHDDDEEKEAHQMSESSRRKPSACLLDESNPTLANLFSQPLMPTELNSSSSPISETTGTNINCSTTAGDNDDDDGSLAVDTDQMTPSAYGRAMDESGFFVIGDDDIGAGIIDKKEHEPLVRKLISEPINIVENHFKMKRPRTIPEALLNCVERYVLEEMTLNINLFGGRDFDDENVVSTNEDASSTTPTTNEPDQALEATNELLDTISAESQLIRSRAGSMACNRQRGAEFNSGSLKRNSLGSNAGGSSGRFGGRRKHFSEGSGARIDLVGGKKTVEQRVRFGEGAVNLWESLDLMSAPDFLGSRQDGPNQPILSADSKHTGGTWRENDVCIQLTLTKVKLLYEIASNLSSPTSNTASKQPNRAQSPTADDSNGTPPVSWRFMLFVQDIEVKDRIAASDINKMLYEYCNESMPKRSTQMLTIKNVATINPSDGCEECDLRVALKPLRLNIDQDTLLFLLDFFTTFCKSLTRQQSIYAAAASSSAATGGGGRPSENSTAGPLNPAKPTSSDNSFGGVTTKTTIIGCKPGTGEGVTRYEPAWRGREETGSQQPIGPMRAANSAADRDSLSPMSSTSSSSSSNLAPFVVGMGSLEGRSAGGHESGERQKRARPTSDIATRLTKKSPPGGAIGAVETINGNDFSEVNSLVNDDDDHEDEEGDFAGGETPLPTHCHTDCDPSENHQPIYIKSFSFSPDVPIRIDYHTKRLNFEQGALAGILMGLADLDHSELILHRVHAKHGMRGLERVLQFAINLWLNDIKRNQLPSILGGVGPMHSVIQLFQGLRDLVWMPIDHYRKDGRLVRGLQRGASSFSSSTAMAAINLVNRFISIVQCTAQIAHDIVTPPTMGPNRSSKHRRRSRAPRSGQSVSSLIGSGGGEVEGGLSGTRRRHHYGHSAAAQHHQSHLEVGSRLHGLAGLSSSSSLHSGGASRAAAAAAAAAASGGLNQPRNFCEGVAVGFTILREGLNDTARNVTVGMQAEDVRSAVGELVRQIPSTLLNPIISATEGAQSVLVGIRNQIAPDARRDDQEKWKGRVRGK